MTAYATGYEPRQMWVNLSSSYFIYFYLLETANGENKTMRIADPSNTSSYLASTLVTLSLDGNRLDQRYTNSSGFVTFFMNDSKDYCVEYEDSTFCNNVTVTVKQPLDEKDPTIKVANYSLYVGGPVSYTYTDLNADKTFTTYLFKDTTTMSVENSTYISRAYYIRGAVAGQNTTIQPYLLKSGDGAWNFFVVEDPSGNILNNAYVTAFRQIGGDYRVVGQIRTDQTGSGQLYLDPTTVYYFIADKYPYNDYLFTIAPQGTTYYITLSMGTSTGEFLADAPRIYLNPTTQTINSTTNITATAYSPSANVINVTLVLTHKGSVVFNKTVADAEYGTTISVNVSSLNLTDWDYWRPLKGEACMYLANGNKQCTMMGEWNNGTSNTGVVKAAGILMGDLQNYSSENSYDINLVKGGTWVLSTLIILLAGIAGNLWVAGVAGVALAALGFIPIWLVMVGFALTFVIMLGRRGGI